MARKGRLKNAFKNAKEWFQENFTKDKILSAQNAYNSTVDNIPKFQLYNNTAEKKGYSMIIIAGIVGLLIFLGLRKNN